MTKEELEAIQAQKDQENQDPTKDQETPENDSVSRKAFEEVSDSMHKFKRRNKEMEMELNRIKAEQEIRERESLKEKEDYKALAERLEAQLEETSRLKQESEQKTINFHKKNAVIQALGGFKKESYSSFIELGNISVDESGNLNQGDVQREVDRIRQNHPELLKSFKSANLPNEAANSDVATGGKDYKNMSPQEKAAYRLELLKKEAQ